MAFTLSAGSVMKLNGVHPDLIRVVKRAAAISELEFIVTCGVRTVTEQKINVAKGASKTMRSRHIPESNACNMSCAVDLAPLVYGKVRWDWPLFHKLAPAMKEAAKLENVAIEWGGDWKTFKDGPHFQLPEKGYPYAKRK